MVGDQHILTKRPPCHGWYIIQELRLHRESHMAAHGMMCTLRTYYVSVYVCIPANCCCGLVNKRLLGRPVALTLHTPLPTRDCRFLDSLQARPISSLLIARDDPSNRLEQNGAAFTFSSDNR